MNAQPQEPIFCNLLCSSLLSALDKHQYKRDIRIMQAQNEFQSEDFLPATMAHTAPQTYRKIGYARVSTRDQSQTCK